MRFVLLGAGSIGQRHLGNLLGLGHRVEAVYDPRDELLGQIERKYSVRTVNSEEAALTVRADAALVCSPTNRHLRQARAAIECGLHVFVEKPLSHTLKGTCELIVQAEKAQRVVLVGCNLRFSPSLLLAKQLLNEGRIGKLLSAKAEFGFHLPYWHPWDDYRQGYSANRRLGGGILLDAIHEFDYLSWVMGDVTQVFAFVDKLSGLEIDTEDVAEVTLKFKGGALGQIHLDYLQTTFVRSLKVIGDVGVIAWDFVGRRVELHDYKSNHYETFLESISVERNAMYIAELEHFMRCINGEECPQMGVAEAKKVLEVVFAAKQSAAQQRIVHMTEYRKLQ